MTVDPDIQAIVTQDVAASGKTTQQELDRWVTSPSGLGVFFSQRAYTLYGLARRDQDQDPYVRSGDLRRRTMAPGRVQLRQGQTRFAVKWQADSRVLNFMKGKNQIYRDQFETVSKAELDGLDRGVQTSLDRLP